MTKATKMTEETFLEDVRRRQQTAWPKGLPRDISYPFGEVPMTDYLREWARRQPDKAALIYYGGVLTFADLHELSDRFAGFLIDHQVQPGDRVGVMLPNCPQFAIAFYGILKAGAVHVPVNPLFRDDEFVYEIEDSGIQLLIAWDVLLPMIQRVQKRAGLRHVVATRLGEYLPEEPTVPVHPMVLQRLDDYGEALPWSAIVNAQPARNLPAADLDALAALNYTGGTTGMPKGCMHTQRNMIYTAACATSLRPSSSVDPSKAVSLVFIPMFWIAGEDGALIIPIFAGSTCVLLARWDPDAVLAAVDRYRVTSFAGTVENFLELLNHPRAPDYDLSSLRGAGAMPFVNKLRIEDRRGFQKLAGPQVTLAGGGWGMTETHTIDTFVSGFQSEDRDLSRVGFCGLPMPGTEFKICDFETGELKSLGEEGEICCRTPSLMKGYWGNPEATAHAIRDGWLHTGDVGMLDEDGCLWFFARRKEMLKVSGMSVFPSEIEVLISYHPDVAGVGVIGIPDEHRGERPVAFVQLREGARGIDGADLTDWCHSHMATYKVPEIHIVAKLPLTATGKVKKHELRELLDN